MTTRTWHSGPPPSVGWWPASVWEDEYSIRWWNGKWWSFAVSQTFSAKKAAACAARRSSYQELIRWTERWWE